MVRAGELVTNAVHHAKSAPRVTVSTGAGRLRVSVHDTDPTIPAPGGPDREPRGGLHLVEELAAAWGVEPAENGSTSNCVARRNTVAMSALRRLRTQCHGDSRSKTHVWP